ncbi:MAG: DUF1194 domain-containing protein [Kiloniellales bacterium]
MRSKTRFIITFVVTLLAAGSGTARNAAPVELALVLLTDVSNSIDSSEYEMVKAGYHAAFSDPEIIAAVSNSPGGVAVAYVEFSDADRVVLVRGWDLLTDDISSRAFGEAVAAAPRSSSGNTALAAALRQAANLLTEGEFADARRLVIDVASDHPSDGGRSGVVRDAAVAAGITINALPIIDERPIGTFDGRMAYTVAHWGLGGMTEFYRQYVIGGPGSFLVEARDYRAFGDALKRKLLMELLISHTDRT